MRSVGLATISFVGCDRWLEHPMKQLPRPLVVQAFISCCLDYCNALLYGITDDLSRRLQSIQKSELGGAPFDGHQATRRSRYTTTFHQFDIIIALSWSRCAAKLHRTSQTTASTSLALNAAVFAQQYPHYPAAPANQHSAGTGRQKFGTVFALHTIRIRTLRQP